MTRRGVTIRLFLAEGSPSGLWIAEKSNWTGVGLSWSRAGNTSARKRAELDRAGVYVLLGPGDLGQNEAIYVGEAEVLRVRLDQHQQRMDFWTRVVAFTTRDGSLNKAHCKYLESRLVELAAKAGRAEIRNGNTPPRPALVESEIADMEGFLEEMLVLYPVLGIKAFEEPAVPAPGVRRLHAKGPGAAAAGYVVPDGFVVVEGSMARAKTVDSMTTFLALRQELVEAGVLAPAGASLTFTKDWLFASPSAASSVVLGRNSNGRTEWRDEAGQTLKEIQTKDVE